MFVFRANIESKLADIEQALEMISVNSSRSHTPADELSRTNTPTPRSSSVAGSSERFPVATNYKVSNIDIDEEKEEMFRFKPNILTSANSNQPPADVNITVRDRHSRDTTLGRKSPRETTRQSPRDILYKVQDKLSRSTAESDTDKESYDIRPSSASSYEVRPSSSSQKYADSSDSSSRKVASSSRKISDQDRQSRRSKHEVQLKEETKTVKQDSNTRKSAKNVHFTPTKDLMKHSSEHDHRHSTRESTLSHFDSIHSSEPLPSKYYSPMDSEKSFAALDPRPSQSRKPVKETRQAPVRTPRDYLSPRETTPSIGHQQSSLYKARSQPELGFGLEQPFSLKESGLGSYKYTSLRDALGKAPSTTSPVKNSSISQEDLRMYPLENTSLSRNQKALSVDIGLHNLGLERSPRKFNPSPEKLNHDAGESPMGTPRLRRKIAPWDREREEPSSSQERVSRDFNRYQVNTKPVRNLVEQFSGVV